MKKMLMLMLVLGMVTAANADLLELSATGNPTAATVDLIGSTYTAAEPDTVFMVYADLSLSSISMVYAGVGSAITDVIGYAAGFEALLGLDAGAVTAAKMIDIKDTEFLLIPNGQLVTSGTTGAGWVYLVNTAGDTVLDSVFIPEPATMILLSLGGLLLRRGKK